MVQGGIIRARWLRQLLALALLLPFLAFSLVKPGTMLATDAQGHVMVVLCGDAAPVEMAVAGDGTLIPVAEVPGHGLKHAACDWAPHAQPLLGPIAAALPALVQVPARLRHDDAPLASVLSRLWLAAGARGPPLTV